MPIYSKSGHHRRQQKVRKIQRRAKWVAVLVSALLLATTLLMVRSYRATGSGGVPPASLEAKNSVLAH